MGNVKFHTMEILWEQLIYFHTMDFESKSIKLKKPRNSQIWGISFHNFPNVWEYFFPVHGKEIGIPISFSLMDFERFFLW